MKIDVFGVIYELTLEKTAHNIQPPMIPVIEIYKKLYPKGFTLEHIQRELNREIEAGRISRHRGINGDMYLME